MRECQSEARLRGVGRGGWRRRHTRRLCYISVNLCSSASHTHHSTPPTSPRICSRACTFPEKKKKSFPTVHDPQGVTVSVSRDCCSQAEPSVSAANHAATFVSCSAVFGLFARPSPDHMQSVCSCAARRLFAGRGGPGRARRHALYPRLRVICSGDAVIAAKIATEITNKLDTLLRKPEIHLFN